MKRTRKGFTLVELLVVIAILAILATVSVVGYTSFINRANDSNAATELHQIQSYINADLMADNKWEYKLEDGTEVKVVKNSDGSLTVVQGATDLADAIAKCPDLQGLGSFAADPENERNLVYTASNGKGKAIWEGVVPPPCTHANTETVTGTAATCTATGLTDGVKCKDCGVMVTAQTEIPVIDHTYVNGVCSCNAIDPDSLFLLPTNIWDQDGAWFAAYFFETGKTEQWIKLTAVSISGVTYYTCDIPEGYTNVIFCRMDSAKTALSWDSMWNQTVDLTIENNCFTIKTISGGTESKSTGEWSTK